VIQFLLHASRVGRSGEILARAEKLVDVGVFLPEAGEEEVLVVVDKRQRMTTEAIFEGRPRCDEFNDVDIVSSLDEADDTVLIATLAEVIRDEFAPDLPIEHGERQAGDADVTKAGDVLGYEPTEDIRGGVRQFIAWYWANREWYEPLVQSS